MTTDNAGAETTVRLDDGRFTISVEDLTVGGAYFADRDGTRVFYHTEIDRRFEGRGLATIVVGAALDATRDAGMRIVPICDVVAHYIETHPEFNAVADPPTPEIEAWVDRNKYFNK